MEHAEVDHQGDQPVDGSDHPHGGGCDTLQGLQPSGIQDTPILQGTTLVALEAQGFKLAVSDRIATARLGIEDEAFGFDILCWAHDITVYLEDRKAVLRNAADLRARLITSMCNVRRAVNADLEKSDGPARWSAFAARVADTLSPDARIRLEGDVADYRHDQVRGVAKDSFVRNVHTPGIPHAQTARFKVTRRGEVQAKILLPGFTLSGRSMHVKGSFPRAYVDALAGRRAEDVVDHPWITGRAIRQAVADPTGIVITLSDQHPH